MFGSAKCHLAIKVLFWLAASAKKRGEEWPAEMGNTSFRSSSPKEEQEKKPTEHRRPRRKNQNQTFWQQNIAWVPVLSVRDRQALLRKAPGRRWGCLTCNSSRTPSLTGLRGTVEEECDGQVTTAKSTSQHKWWCYMRGWEYFLSFKQIYWDINGWAEGGQQSMG